MPSWGDAAPSTGRGAASRARSWTLSLALLAACAISAPARAQNPIVTENQLPGDAPSVWDVSGSGDASIQGYATDISVNRGQRVRFKIKTTASSYEVRIYRLGYYQGNGARRVGTGTISASLPQSQPACLTSGSTGLIDCGNWAESAYWDVPANAVSGIYLAKLVRSSGGSSHIAFIVRNDASTSDLLFQTSDATWQAYNGYGGNSLYVGNTSNPGGRAAKVSYNRPFSTRAGGGGSGEAGQDWLFNAEYPMVRWLEANGYDVTYTTNVDGDRRGNLIQNHRVFLSVGHDEYWSGALRANVEAARAAGVHLAFFSGNEVYWKTRFENSIDASSTAYRTLVCYKEGTLGEFACGGKCDPMANVWTGLWRDGCSFSPPADGCRPENELSGQISWKDSQVALQVSSAYKDLRFWRNTAVASLSSGQTLTMTAGTLGYEWDQQQWEEHYPSPRILLSETQASGDTHHLSLYRHSSSALVFGAGTVQWSWGLDSNHDRGSAEPSVAMQQATVNLFADMNAQPGSLRPGLVPATMSTDVTPPVTTILNPEHGASLTRNVPVTISGTASDAAGTVVGVQVSVDGGATWNPANGASSWTYGWTPTATGSYVIKARGFDDSGNLETPGTPPAADAIVVEVVASGGNTRPVAAATAVPTSGTTPLQVDFSAAASTDADGDSLTFAWTFGDVGTGEGRIVSHVYPNPGEFAAIVTVTDGRGLSDTASVPIRAIYPGSAFPQNAMLDNFNRANGPIGGSWIDQTSGFSIESNRLAPGSGTSYIEWSAPFGPSQEVFARLAAIAPAGTEHNLMLKTQGTTWTSGHIEVSYDAPGSRVWVYSFTPPSAWNTHGSIPGIVFAAGDQFGARALSDGTVQVYRNGAVIGAVSVSAWPNATQGGRIGVSVATASGARFDDFGGGTLQDGVAHAESPIGSAPWLSPAYPNPTHGGIELALVLPRDEDVALSVIDVQGREVWSAAPRRHPAGRSSLAWDGRAAGAPARTGVYLVRTRIGAQVLVRRIAIVR